MKIESVRDFNDAPDEDAVELLSEIFCSPSLARAVVAHRPFADVDAVLVTARSELGMQPEAEVMDAINAHPAIGADVAIGSFSEAEQSAANAADEESRQAMGNIRSLATRYEEQHGFRFLIRAAGLTSRQILDDLSSRIENPTHVEKTIVREQLGKINELRLQQTLRR